MRIASLVFLLLFIQKVSAQSPEEQLRKLNISLPAVSQPIANYVKFVRTGNLIFLAGHGPTGADGVTIIGKVGSDLSIEEGYQAARTTAISLLATLQQAIGSLNKVKRIVKVNGYVNCGSDFTQHPKVINGCSDLLVQVFGEKAKHARAAMGMNSLPNNMAVEIEMVVEVE